METDPTRMCELLVGLPDVRSLGVHGRANDVLRIYVESKGERPGCTNCGVLAQLKDRAAVELVDLACLGRATRLIWHKCRWKCAEALCPVGSWTEEDTRIAAPRIVLSDRAARWVTLQVGYYARSVNDLALELGCDWHTVSDAVIAMAPHWWTMTPSGSGIVGALGPTKFSSPGTAPFTAKSSPPRSSTSPGASSSTSFLVAVVHTPRRGWRNRESNGGRRSATPPWICRAPPQGLSPPWCPTRSRSPIRSTW